MIQVCLLRGSADIKRQRVLERSAQAQHIVRHLQVVIAGGKAREAERGLSHVARGEAQGLALRTEERQIERSGRDNRDRCARGGWRSGGDGELEDVVGVVELLSGDLPSSPA